MTDIFLSYTERDRDTARRIAEALGSAGWTVWWDRRIPAGETWRTVLDHALEDMRCMVVLWSAKSIESEWVYEEASEGRRQRKLVPVMIENVRPPAGFREIQAADLSGWDGSPDFDGLRMLLADLENLLGKPASQATAQHGTADPPPSGHGDTDADRDLPYGKTERPGYSPPTAPHGNTRWQPWVLAGTLLLAAAVVTIGLSSRQHTVPATPAPAPVSQQPAISLPPMTPAATPPPSASVQRERIDAAFTALEASRAAVETTTSTRSHSKLPAASAASTKRGEVSRPYDHCSEMLAKIQLGETLNSVEQTIFDGKCKR